VLQEIEDNPLGLYFTWYLLQRTLWSKLRPDRPSRLGRRYLITELAHRSSRLRVRWRSLLLEGEPLLLRATPGGTAGPSRLHVRGTGQILKSVPSVGPRRPSARLRVWWRSWISKPGRCWLCRRRTLLWVLEGRLSIMRQKIRNVGESHPLSRGLRYFAYPSPVLPSGVEAQANAAHLVDSLPLNLGKRQTLKKRSHFQWRNNGKCKFDRVALTAACRSSSAWRG
jgi:hypothetical protein